MTPDQLKYLFFLPPEQIVQWYKSKGYTFSWNWQEVWQEAHAKSFAVAKVMRLDILQSIKEYVDKIFTEGYTYQQFQKGLEPILKKLGWWDKVKASDVPGYDPASGIDPNKIVQLGSPSRLKTIYATNANVAYSAGRYKMMAANAANRPYWQYKQLERKRKRIAHTYYADKIFRADDPIWNIIFPPNGWYCGCYVLPLSQAEVESRGLETSSGADFQIKDIPPEWQYNPGKEAFKPDLSKYDKSFVNQFNLPSP